MPKGLLIVDEHTILGTNRRMSESYSYVVRPCHSTEILLRAMHAGGAGTPLFRRTPAGWKPLSHRSSRMEMDGGRVVV